MKKKSNAGRPTVMSEAVVKKLEDWFIMWLSDSEACLYADISKQTLYDYCKKHPGFTDRKELLKDQPKLLAKLNIHTKLKEWDDFNSRWYLERKSKDEFSLRQENQNDNTNVDVTDNLSVEQKKKLTERYLKLYG